mgnify:CR=1 FL=1
MWAQSASSVVVRSSAASEVYKRQRIDYATLEVGGPFSCEGFRPAVVAYDYNTADYLALGRAFTEDRVSGRTAIAGTFYRRGAGRQPLALLNSSEHTRPD